MKQFLTISTICLYLTACHHAKRVNTPTLNCPSYAPLFTAQLGTELINNWGQSVQYYSPNAGTYPNVNVGAAYFTAANYTENAVLLPTVSPITRHDPQGIYEYFVSFLSHCPVLTNNPIATEGPFATLEACGFGTISGYYNFKFTCGEPGEPMARYTFQFEYIADPNTVSININGGSTVSIPQPAGQWYIMLQNSAALPTEH